MIRSHLIHADELELPYWARVDGDVATARTWRRFGSVPRVVARTVRGAWRASPWLTATAAALQLAGGIVTAFGLLATANVFTRLLAGGPGAEQVVAALPAMAVVVAAYAAGGLLDAATALAKAALEPRVEHIAQDRFHAAVVGIDLVAHDDADFVDLVRRAGGPGLSHLRSATSTVGDLLGSLVSVAAGMVTAGLLHPVLAPAVLLTVLPRAWASVRAARLSYASFLATSARRRKLAVTAELITSRADAAELRAFTAQDVVLAEHRRLAADLMAETIRVHGRTTGVRLVGRAIAGVGTAAAYAVLGLLIVAGALPLALAGAAALALRTATSAVSTSVFAANRLYESSLYLDLLDRCVADAAGRTRTATGSLPAGAPSTVEVEAVTFRYPGQDHLALDGVSLTLHTGQVVALVGENGSGKSTLGKLLTGLYLPDTGTVRWDGRDVAGIAPRELYDRVAVVVQSPTQWPTTAEYNVRVGRLDRPDPDGHVLRAAAAGSGAADVVAGLPSGWDTLLSRRFTGGRDLSGGQWQRVSVARGLYRDAPLVVADEPTAAMDAAAEHAAFTHLRALRAGRIVVLVTHRLANVHDADLIVVLHRGQVAEQGTHDELLAAGGRYAAMYEVQAAAFAEAGDAVVGGAGEAAVGGAG